MKGTNLFKKTVIIITFFVSGCAVNPASKNIPVAEMSNYELVECRGDTGLSTLWTHNKMDMCSAEIQHRIETGRMTEQEFGAYGMGLDQQAVEAQQAIINSQPKQVYVSRY
ncbi:hypothetical protein ACNJN1_10405 [Citrobacter freundii]